MAANTTIINGGGCTGLLPPHVHSMLYHSGLLAPEFVPEQQPQPLQVRGDTSTQHQTIKGVRRQLNPPPAAPTSNPNPNSAGQPSQQQQQQRYDPAEHSGTSAAAGSTHLHPSKAGAPSASVLDSPFFQRVNNNSNNNNIINHTNTYNSSMTGGGDSATPSSSGTARTPSQIRCTPWAAEANNVKGGATCGSMNWSSLGSTTPAGLSSSAYGRRYQQQGLSASPGTPQQSQHQPPAAHHYPHGSALPSPVTTARSGVALEKQLLQASKEELVQILLDLGSCSAEASTFIHTKARFFAMRHGDLDDELDRMEGPSTRRALQLQESSTQLSQRPTPTRPAAAAAVPPEAKVGGHSPDTAPPSAARGAHPDTRPFCAELHPCMRWYGGCRNATSCIFAAAPQNLCLNWTRGSCAAGAACSGVHRLPEGCSTEVRRVYDLNHGGVDRAALLLQQQQQQPASHEGPAATPQTPLGQALRPSTCSPQPHHSPFYDYREELMSSDDEAQERRAADDDDLGAEAAQEAAQAMSVVCRCLQGSFSRAAAEEGAATDHHTNSDAHNPNESSCSLSVIHKDEAGETTSPTLAIPPPPPAAAAAAKPAATATSPEKAKKGEEKKGKKHKKAAAAKTTAAARPAEEEGYDSPAPAPGDRTREHTPEPERKR